MSHFDSLNAFYKENRAKYIFVKNLKKSIFAISRVLYIGQNFIFLIFFKSCEQIWLRSPLMSKIRNFGQDTLDVEACRNRDFWVLRSYPFKNGQFSNVQNFCYRGSKCFWKCWNRVQGRFLAQTVYLEKIFKTSKNFYFWPLLRMGERSDQNRRKQHFFNFFQYEPRQGTF